MNKWIVIRGRTSKNDIDTEREDSERVEEG